MNQTWLNSLVAYISSNWAAWEGFNLSWDSKFNVVDVHMKKSWSSDDICGDFYFDEDKGQHEFNAQSRLLFDTNATNAFTVFFILQALDMHQKGSIEGYKSITFPL